MKRGRGSGALRSSDGGCQVRGLRGNRRLALGLTASWTRSGKCSSPMTLAHAFIQQMASVFSVSDSARIRRPVARRRRVTAYSLRVHSRCKSQCFFCIAGDRKEGERNVANGIGPDCIVTEETARGAIDGLLSSKDSLRIGACAINGRCVATHAAVAKIPNYGCLNIDESRRAFIRARMKSSICLTRRSRLTGAS